MTDNNDDKTLNAPAKKTLTLKPSGASQGTVRQDMGRGRTNAVVVETRKRRPLRPEDEKHVIAPVAARPAAPAAAAPSAPRPQQPQQRVHQSGNQQRPAPSPQPQRQPDRPRGNVLHDLSAGEMDARRRALAEAQARDIVEAKQRAEDEARRKVEEEARLVAEKKKRPAALWKMRPLPSSQPPSQHLLNLWKARLKHRPSLLARMRGHRRHAQQHLRLHLRRA